MRPPDHAEPWNLPEARALCRAAKDYLAATEAQQFAPPPQEDIEGALILLAQCRGLVPKRLSAVLAALNVAETGLREALAQPPLLEEEGQGK